MSNDQTLRPPANIGLDIAVKYRKGAPGVFLAKEIADAITAERKVPSWHNPSVLPEVPRGTQRTFIVAVRRARSGKVYSWPALYLNGYQLQYEDGGCPCGAECKGLEDGCPTTGWYTENSEGEYDHNYSPLYMNPGDEMVAWTEVPQYEAPQP